MEVSQKTCQVDSSSEQFADKLFRQRRDRDHRICPIGPQGKTLICRILKEGCPLSDGFVNRPHGSLSDDGSMEADGHRAVSGGRILFGEMFYQIIQGL